MSADNFKKFQENLFTGEIVRIGTFSAAPDAARFHNTGPIGGQLIVFPRVPVLITHAGGKPIVATPNHVMLYNNRQEYCRDALSPQGDQSHWFSFAENTILDILQTETRKIPPLSGSLFQYTHGPIVGECYAMQRQLIEYLHRNPLPDRLLVEETALSILSSAIRSTYQAWSGLPVSRPLRKGSTDTEVAHALERLLAVNFRNKLTLETIAAEIAYSPFHISRVFKKETGQTLHQYLNQIRLRTAFEEIQSGASDLAQLAIDLGFSSHSHFTVAFSRAFGQLPSRVRQSTFLQS